MVSVAASDAAMKSPRNGWSLIRPFPHASLALINRDVGRRAARTKIFLVCLSGNDDERIKIMQKKHVKELMESDMALIAPDATLEEAARKMKDIGCGFLPVGEGETPEGIITDRDIVI